MMDEDYVTIMVIYLPFNDYQFSESNTQHSILDFLHDNIA